MYKGLSGFYLREKLRFILFAVLMIFSCEDDCPSKSDGTERIHLEPGTTSVMMEFSSSADGKTIPVYLALPPSGSNLKAVVVLHGSGGPWNDDDTNGDGIGDVCNAGTLSKQNKEWEALLLSHNYAIAFPDSYSPRNTCENEGDYKIPPLKFTISGTFIRNHDAYGVLELLKQLTWKDSNTAIIDINNVALLGFSDGGTAVLSTVYDKASTPSDWIWKQSFDDVTYTSEILPPAEKNGPGFKAAVVYYPGSYQNGYYGTLCSTGGIYQSYCDLLFHLAGQDPLTEGSECLLATMNKRGGGKTEVHRYDEASHSFDSNDQPESETARIQTLEFLKDKLK